MARTKFFRIAVQGATVDGREITRDQIQQMADGYNPATYTARINCEHLRGYSPDAPFNAWGSVAAVKAEEITLSIGGKDEKRLALFAQFDVTDQAMAYNQAGQKLFSSVEIQPDFAKTGKAYLVGLAFTDSPASLGTEVLQFSRDEKRKDNLAQIAEFELAFEDAAPPAAFSDAVLDGIKRFFAGFKAPEPEPKPEPKPEPGAAPDLAAFAAGLGQQFEAMTTAFQTSVAALETRFAALDAKHNTLAETIEKTPSRSYTARPAGGGDGRALAEC